MRRPVVAILVTVACVGCTSPVYLARLGWNQVRLLLRREPIPALLARPDLDPDLRARLDLVLAARDFARDRLGFKVGDSYTTFADVDHDDRVYVLSAAHRDRLEAYTWWYPIVGRVPYRGFFDQGEAERAGAVLTRRDLDVEVRPAAAFSTLGWFADPLLSTTASAPPVPVVETVLHELFHSTLYLPGEAAFDESAATFAGHRGAIAFFCGGSRQDPDRCAEARRRWDRTRARGRLLGRFAARLRRLYAASPPAAERERARNALAVVAARALERGRLGAARELVPPNNASLLGELIYTTSLDDFQRLAPTDADLGPALGRLAGAVRGARDPFEALEVLASGAERR